MLKKAAHSKSKRNNQDTAFKPYKKNCLLINHVKHCSKSCQTRSNSIPEFNIIYYLC